MIPWRSAAALAFPPDAQALAWEEHALAVRFGAPRAIGRALRALAAVGTGVGAHGRAAERPWQRSTAARRGSNTRTRSATSARACAANAHRRDAREPLREALDLAVRCGATALARRAREELAATGARPRRLAQSGRDALTPAELRVARLAARGLANREIAQTLVVTVKTVETELGHAYAKLGIRSRRELAGVLEAAVRAAAARRRAGPARRRTRACRDHAASAGRGAPPLPPARARRCRSRIGVRRVLRDHADARSGALGVVMARERLGRAPAPDSACARSAVRRVPSARLKRVLRHRRGGSRLRCTTPPGRRRGGGPLQPRSVEQLRRSRRRASCLRSTSV